MFQREHHRHIAYVLEPLADQYGIRARVVVVDVAIKFEIVLLANSDRWNDDSVFNRDVPDIAHHPLAESLPGIPGH